MHAIASYFLYGIEAFAATVQVDASCGNAKVVDDTTGRILYESNLAPASLHY